MRAHAEEFLGSCPDCWISRQAARFPVINIHAVEATALPERVFAALSNATHIAPGWHWRALMVLRAGLGKLFGWDTGLKHHGPEPLVPGNHYSFFRIEHVAAPGDGAAGPYELGLSVENKLTLALVSFVVVPTGDGTRVFNVTCAVFKGRLGRAYWRVIRPFHDAIAEAMLTSIRRQAPMESRQSEDSR